jgi:hypothetical protein
LPILGLGKKPEQKKEDAPDELPELPQASALGQTSQAVPDELPMPEPSLAPDELPPVGGGLGPADATGDDKRLYFSIMMQKLHDEGLKSTKLMSPTANLLVDMKKHWKQRKKADELDEMMRKVGESINPLQKLEQEWVSLQDEIEEKKRMLSEKEEAIKKLVEEARSLAIKAESMKSQQKQ